MKIFAPISIGELYDKISILEIKNERIKDEKKLLLVKKEFDELYRESKKCPISQDDYEDLLNINEALWGIEDNIREKERRKEFDEIFIKLARAVYFQNDTRSEIKKRINLQYGSELVEVKSYKDYA